MRGMYDRCRRLGALAVCLAMLMNLLPAQALAGRSFYMPDQLTVIETEAFAGDARMDELFLNEGVTRIESRAFANTGLTFAVLPKSLTYIADDAFDGCPEDIFFCVIKGSYAEAWCERVGKDCYTVTASGEVCTLAAPASPVLDAGAAAAEIDMHDTAACTVKVEDAAWLTAAVDGRRVKVTAQPNTTGSARSAQLLVTCAHGHTRWITVTQQAHQAPALQIACGGKAVSDGGSLGTVMAGEAAQLKFSFTAAHAETMTIAVTDAKAAPVSGLGYSGPVKDAWTLELPADLAEGRYYVTVTVTDGMADNDGLPHSAAMTVNFMVLDVNNCPVGAVESSLSMDAKGGTQQVDLLTDTATSVSWPDANVTDEAAKWLTVKAGENGLTITARENYATTARSQEITVVCAHGVNHTFTVTQQPSEDAAVTLSASYDGKEAASGEVLVRVNNGKDRQVTVEVKASDSVRRMTAVLTDKDLQPVTAVKGLPYTGDAVDSITFTIPQGIAYGDYQLTITAFSSPIAGDKWQQSETYAAVVNVGRAVTPFADMSAAYKGSVFYDRLMDVTLTGDKVYDMIQIAKSQLDYHEGTLDGMTVGSNDCTEYCRWLGHNNTAWCASFVSWCAALAGIDTIHPYLQVAPGKLFTSADDGHVYSFRSYSYVKQSASTPITFMNDSTRCTYVQREEFIPRRGDLIIFSNSRYALAHIGVVDYYEDGVVYYYDGNGDKSEKVKYNSMEVTNTNICMYMRPNIK